MRKLEDIYHELREMGTIQNQYEFSALFGKKPSWLSSLKSKGRPVTTDALVHLFINLDDIADASMRAAISDTQHKAEYEAGANSLKELSRTVWVEIQQRVLN